MSNRRTHGQCFALGCAITMGLALAAYGALGSYETVSDKAAQLGVPFPNSCPLASTAA